MAIKHLQFFLPDIECAACIGGIETALKDTKRLFIRRFNIDIRKKILHVDVNDMPDVNSKNILSVEELKEIIINIVKETGNGCIDKNKAKQKPKSFWTSHLFLGLIGAIAGIALMTISIAFPLLPLGASIAIAVAGTVLTLVLGAPSYYSAFKKLFKSGTLTMDTLFTVSTLAVLGVSIAAFFVPGLSMMFEAGLLIFGFRHIGLAIEETIQSKIDDDEPEFLDRLPEEILVVEGQQKNTKKLIELKAGDRVYLEADKQKPTNKVYIPADGIAKTEATVYETIYNGAVTPTKLQIGDKVLAGMYLAEDSIPLELELSKVSVVLKAGDDVPIDSVCTKIEKDCQLENGTPIKVGDNLAKYATLSEKSSPILVDIDKEVAFFSHSAKLDASLDNARYTKAPIELITNRILKFFIPTVIIIAILAAVAVGYYLIPFLAVKCAVAILASACPCILGLINSLAIQVGFKKGVANGVYFKTHEKLESASGITDVVYDLNRTLTTGNPEVSKIALKKGLNYEDILKDIELLERDSKHPTAVAIKEYIEKTQIALSEEFLDSPLTHHAGMRGKINNVDYAIGSETLINELMIGATNEEQNKFKRELARKINLENDQYVVYLVRDKELIGYIILRDPLRDGAKETVKALQKMGKTVHICTGADEATAKRYANSLGINHFSAECVSYSENEAIKTKSSYIKELHRDKKKKVCFIGDGDNDALVLAESDFGIAVGPNEMAKAKASAYLDDSQLKKTGLRPIANIFKIAEQTVSNIKQNLGFTLGYNFSVLILSAVLLLTFGFVLNPAIGVVLMVTQACLVLLNILYLKHQSLSFDLKEIEKNNAKSEVEDNNFTYSQMNGLGVANGISFIDDNEMRDEPIITFPFSIPPTSGDTVPPLSLAPVY